MTTVETPRTIAATVTASGALAAGKHTPVDATAGPVTVTLPASATPGAHLSVAKTDATTNTVTVSGTIRGTATTTVLSLQGSSVTFRAENSGNSWTPSEGRITETSLTALLALKRGYDQLVSIPSATGAVTLSTTSGAAFSLTLTGAVTFTLNSARAVDSLTAYITQDATGSRAVTWPASVKWVGSPTAPTINGTAGSTSVYVFETIDNGTTWYGSLLTGAPTLPLTVQNGGTGNGSATAFTLLAGGTSTTGPLQSLPSTGTAGQVLTSAGAASLPAWSALPASPATWIPADSGFLATSAISPWLMSGTSNPTNGVIYLYRIALRGSTTISNVCVGGSVAAAGGASTGTYAAVFDSAGNLLGSSADAGAIYATAPTATLFTIPLTAPVTPTTSWVYAALLFNMTALPTLVGTGSSAQARTGANLGLTAPTYMFANQGSGLTAIPATLTLANNLSSSANPNFVAFK